MRWKVVSTGLMVMTPFVACVSVTGADEPAGDDAAAAYVRALADGAVEQIQTNSVSLGYAVDSDSPVVRGAELFYTTDLGRQWVEADLPNPLANPISFNAPDDGLYGFWFVLHSATGSMPRPTAGAIPQRWVMVDRAAPKISIRSINVPAVDATTREISVSWLATDESNNLGQRPVSIEYRDGANRASGMREIARGLPAQGEHHWTVPMNVSGPVTVRVTAVDRAGNREHIETREIALPEVKLPASLVHANATVTLATMTDATTAVGTNGGDGNSNDTKKSQDSSVISAYGLVEDSDPAVNRIDPGAAAAAKKEYDLGLWHRRRGEYETAISRYRAALALAPNDSSARVELAGTLLVAERFDEAVREYERALELDRRNVSALAGLALAQLKQRAYASAHETFGRLLEIRPDDGEAWLHYGDASMFMGDRRGAREAWRAAVSHSGDAASLKSRADRRLAIYQRDRLGAD